MRSYVLGERKGWEKKPLKYHDKNLAPKTFLDSSEAMSWNIFPEFQLCSLRDPRLLAHVKHSLSDLKIGYVRCRCERHICYPFDVERIDLLSYTLGTESKPPRRMSIMLTGGVGVIRTQNNRNCAHSRFPRAYRARRAFLHSFSSKSSRYLAVPTTD